MTERDYKGIVETLCLVAKNAAEIKDYSGFEYIVEQNLRIAWLEGYGTAKGYSTAKSYGTTKVEED